MGNRANKKKKASKQASKGSNTPSPSNSSWLHIEAGNLRPEQLILYQTVTKKGWDEEQVKELFKEYSKLEGDRRHLFDQEIKQRFRKMEEQLRSGASVKQIMEAHAQGANENMKGVLTGVTCAILVGLMLVAAWSYTSKESSREAAAGTDNGDDSDDDWQNAAKGSSVEQLKFAAAKLRKMNV